MNSVSCNRGSEDRQKADKSSRLLWVKLLSFLLLSAFLIALAALTPLRSFWRGSDGIEFIENLGPAGPLILILAGAVSPLFFLPRWPLATGAAMLYGLVWGGLLANFASTLGALLQFLIAKRTLSPTSDKMLARYGYNPTNITPRRAFTILLALRVFPLSNYVATNLLAASLHITHRSYLIATFLGMLPSTFLYGALGRTVLHHKLKNWLVFIGLFVLLSLLAWQAARWLNSNRPTKEGKTEDKKQSVDPVSPLQGNKSDLKRVVPSYAGEGQGEC